MKTQKEYAKELLALAGVEINGQNPWDIVVHNENFYSRVFALGSLGLGESYMDGWWDCERLDEFFNKLIRAKLDEKVKNWKTTLHYLQSRLINYQKKSKAFVIAEKHYDIGNELFVKMLGKSMVYTCAYWKGAVNLEEAQKAKLELVCRKIGLKPGMKILDVGCGFGSFMKHAAVNYGVSCVGVSVSKEQIKFGREFCKGLPIEFKYQDYRDITGQFDHVVSIGMAEAVGYKNLKIYMKTLSEALKPNGLFLLHTIGSNISLTAGDPWIKKYIFPNGLVPSLTQITKNSEKLFVLEDLHNFGADYDKTLMAWYNNFDQHWPELQDKYGHRFYRMWKYYLLACAGLFRARGEQLWQFVFSKDGVTGGYGSLR